MPSQIMNYELAVKLKNAGFPLHPASVEDAKDSKRKKQIFCYGKDDIGRDGVWLFPTLSELIEACEASPKGESDGRQSFFLRADYVEKDGVLERVWGAGYKDTLHVVALSENPEEAVANLWLALNK